MEGFHYGLAGYARRDMININCHYMVGCQEPHTHSENRSRVQESKSLYVLEHITYVLDDVVTIEYAQDAKGASKGEVQWSLDLL